MKKTGNTIVTCTFLILAVLEAKAARSPGVVPRCPPDSVLVGTACVDTYEASVWEIPETETALIREVQRGRISEASELIDAGAKQVGAVFGVDDYAPDCPSDGQGCGNLYAVSIKGVAPSSGATWFQALELCTNSGKRLLSNAEWQAAATGTPNLLGYDDGATTCNVGSAPYPVVFSPTGSRSQCESNRGAFDMVGNLAEWVADWGVQAAGCGNWTTAAGIPGGDTFCWGQAASGLSVPRPIVRGGAISEAAGAGVLNAVPVDPLRTGFGFRCAR